MNVETLNRWGENFLSFAWPMFCQSALLIAVVFALDVLSARKIRPAVHHALWMVVLIKLLLPPALALPTGAAWWLWPVKPALMPVFKNTTVAFDPTIPYTAPPTTPMVEPPVRLDHSGWALLVSGVMSAGLLCWLVFKWLSVGRTARKAEAAGEIENLFDEARQLAGLRRQVRLRLIDGAQSPAVYGLFRPVILLPRALAERLSAKQLRAVLLHEAIHVRRGDVWVNCAQTLLQIFYWWHPLLWFANARIRRLREEAVDDAVMVALRADADAYAPTLLEVAKFAFRRPLASLGLVGILESRSALRQRIERLVDFRPPRKAGVTLLSLCGILAFSAVALPMGQAPVSTTDSVSANSRLPSAGTSPVRTAVLIEGRFFWMRSSDVETLTAGLPTGAGQTSQVRKWMADAKNWEEINQRIHSLNVKPFIRPRIQTGSGIEADFYIGDTNNGYELDCTPFIADGRVDLTFKAKVRSDSLHDTDYFIVHEHATVDDGGGVILRAPEPKDSSSNLVLVVGVKTVEPALASEKDAAAATDVLVRDGQMLYDAGKFDEAQSKLKGALALDPDNQAAQYYLNLVAQAKAARASEQASIHDGSKAILDESLSIHLEEFGPYKNAPLAEVVNELNQRALNAGAAFKIMISPMTPSPNEILVNLPQMKDVAFATVFDMITQGTNRPVNFSYMDDSIVFKGAKDDLVMRTFKVDTDLFYSRLNEYLSLSNGVSGLTPGFNYSVQKPRDISFLAKEFFRNVGVNMDPPKTIYFNESRGVLFVYATVRDLDVIERALTTMNVGTIPTGVPPPQIHVKARFIEVPSTADFVANLMPADKSKELGYGILTASQMKAVWQQLQSQDGMEELAEPEATTLSGRQVQMRATQTQQIVTNYLFQPRNNSKASTMVAQINNEEFGPMFDVVPVALADGFTISLKAIGSRTQFFGYADPKGLTGFSTNYDGAKIYLPVTLPAAQMSSASAQDALLYDQQTLVLFPKAEQLLDCPPDQKSRERIAQHIRQAEKQDGNKTLVVLVTVTLIDPAGNRVHSDDDMPFAQDSIPPQPIIWSDVKRPTTTTTTGVP